VQAAQADGKLFYRLTEASKSGSGGGERGALHLAGSRQRMKMFRGSSLRSSGEEGIFDFDEERANETLIDKRASESPHSLTHSLTHSRVRRRRIGVRVCRAGNGKRPPRRPSEKVRAQEEKGAAQGGVIHSSRLLSPLLLFPSLSRKEKRPSGAEVSRASPTRTPSPKPLSLGLLRLVGGRSMPRFRRKRSSQPTRQPASEQTSARATTPFEYFRLGLALAASEFPQQGKREGR